MSEKVVILSAFRGDGEGYGGKGHRDRAFTHCYDEWGLTPWSLSIGDSGDDPFNISKSYNKAANTLGWDKAILHPPDERVEMDQLKEAVELAGPGVGLVYAFDHEIRLTEEGTTSFYEGKGVQDVQEVHIAERRPKKGKPMPAYSGPRVITRELWEDIGGFDERIRGWGGEDDIIAHCARILGGPHKRVAGPMISLFHPRHRAAPKAEKAFFANRAANRVLRDEYRRIKDPIALRAHIRAVR